jgi:hypothetical protein
MVEDVGGSRIPGSAQRPSVLTALIKTQALHRSWAILWF